MRIILKVQNTEGEDIDMTLTDEDFSDRNWISIMVDGRSVEVYVPDLQRALAAFRYPMPDEIKNNKPACQKKQTHYYYKTTPLHFREGR